MEEKKVSQLFTECWKMYFDIEDSSEPSLSSKYQSDLTSAISATSHLYKVVNELDLFSCNEEIEEVATSDLKFILTSAILGKLYMKKTCKDASERPKVLESSSEFLKKFLKLCVSYNLEPNVEIEEILLNKNDKNELVKIGGNKTDELKAQADNREMKIRRYKEAKARKEKISELESREDSLDDATMREFWLIQIKHWIYEIIDEIKSINEEERMLRYMKSISHQKPTQRSPPGGARGQMPFMLTRDKLQSSVFGAGYPSLPTMTLDEFYEREVAAGRVSDSGNRVSDTKDEESDDDDDDSKIEAKRQMDDFKDTHRRGDGNRYRKG